MQLVCGVHGDSETGPKGTTDLWDRTPAARYISDAFVDTGGRQPALPACSPDITGRATPDMTIRTAPVLGLRNRLPNGEGWGTVAPSTIFNGGDPNGMVSKITWTGWGSSDAYGTGQEPIFKPEGGYYDQPAAVQLRASDIGTCASGGPRAYRKLYVRAPDAPGGPLGPWQAWGPTDADICHGVG